MSGSNHRVCGVPKTSENRDMCGLVAILSREGKPVSEEDLDRGIQALAHRGPDDNGRWVPPSGRIGLGHTRLSIIAPETGAQPIADEKETLHIVVNGEFYDYESIRKDLETRGHRFSTGSDSEIALHLYQEQGAACLQYLRGEFAFVLWDEAAGTLFAARDRFGIKPLFYAQVNGMLYLASEAKALFAAGVPASRDEESVFQQLFISVAEDQSVFRHVHQVPPGHFLNGDAAIDKTGVLLGRPIPAPRRT